MNFGKGKFAVTAGVGLALAALVASSPSQAQPNVGNLEKLKQMKVSGPDPSIPRISCART